MFGHTPGPWKVSRRFDVYQDIGYAAGGTYIGTTRGNKPLPASVQRVDEANAKLIAAAPDMKELLVRCYNAIHRQQWQDGETESELSERINDLMDQHFGMDWHEAVGQSG